jgi:hypothetical protein
LEFELENPQGDPVLAALHLAAEDDAVNTKSTVCLPVPAFSKRLDNLVAQLGGRLRSNDLDCSNPQTALDHLTDTLFGAMRFRCAVKRLELFSPYRIYMHKVLTQRCGTPEALAVLLASFVRRAQRAGHISDFDFKLGLPEKPGQLPCACVAGTKDMRDGVRCDLYMSMYATSDAPAVTRDLYCYGTYSPGVSHR